MELSKSSVKDLQLLAMQQPATVPSAAHRAQPTVSSSGQSSSQISISNTSTPEPGYSPSKSNAKRKNRRKQAHVTAIQPLESGEEAGDSGYDDGDPLSKDFDFAGGLKAFDKAKVRLSTNADSAPTGLTRPSAQVWAEIASADTTDPALRLVSHNRKVKEDPQRKLGNTEMVLSSEEQLVNGVARTTLSSLSPNSIVSSHGVVVQPLTAEQLTNALQSASVETGPNLVQRVENGARAIASYSLSILRHDSRQHQVTILANGTLKGSYALRAGAHLANRGCKITALITGSRPTPAFEFYIRLLLASGGNVCAKSNGRTSLSLSQILHS